MAGRFLRMMVQPPESSISRSPKFRRYKKVAATRFSQFGALRNGVRRIGPRDPFARHIWMPVGVDPGGESFHCGKKSTWLLSMMLGIGRFLAQLGDQVQDTGILLFEPAVSEVQLVAQNQSKRTKAMFVVNVFHRECRCI